MSSKSHWYNHISKKFTVVKIFFQNSMRDSLADLFGGYKQNHGASAVREKCPYSEFFWPMFSRIWTEYGDISPYSVRMRENRHQKNSEYGYFSRSAYIIKKRERTHILSAILMKS